MVEDHTGWSYWLSLFQASIVRNAKDTAHTRAERNILEAIKVTWLFTASACRRLRFSYLICQKGKLQLIPVNRKNE